MNNANNNLSLGIDDQVCQVIENVKSIHVMLPFILDMPNKIVSSAYYAVFHAENAMLESIGVDAKTHSGAMDLFSKHFVLGGAFDKSASKAIVKLMDARHTADYGKFIRHDEEDVRDILDVALRFLCEFTKRVQEMPFTLKNRDELVRVCEELGDALDSHPGASQPLPHH